jgi:hypothetical protein
LQLASPERRGIDAELIAAAPLIRGRRHRLLGVDAPRAIVLLVDGVEVGSWPVVLDGAPDLGLVDALARLQLAAQRGGGAIRLRNPCPTMRALLELVGLSEVLLVEVLGQPEEREELRVQEVVERGDPAV